MRRKLSSKKTQEIRELRSKGYSITEISNALKISKSTALRYSLSVEILPEFLEKWASKRGGSTIRKNQMEQKALEYAKDLFINLSQREKLLFISALYWAEGNKKDFILTNTDPYLIKVFVTGLRDLLNVSEESIKVSLRIYEDIDQDKSLSYWSKIVNIPKEKFLKTQVLPGKKKGKLEFGMCRLRVARGGNLLKKVASINKVVSDSFSMPL